MTDVTTAAKPRRLLSFLLGIAGGVRGIAPWLAKDDTLPLQNLWFENVALVDMPFVLLPVKYSATTLFSLVLLGGVFAGGAVQVIRRFRPGSAPDRQRSGCSCYTPSRPCRASSSSGLGW